LRIISGCLRGRKLHSPPARGNVIRPTSDRAREAVFSIIGGRIPGASALDLFAGTGALGLEALSRGASSVCFVDFHPLALDLIHRNIQICMDALSHQKKMIDKRMGGNICDNHNMSNPAVLIKHDLRKGLPLFSKKLQFSSGFDLIFLDPPYSQGLSIQLLRALDASPLLRHDTLLIVEDRAQETLPAKLARLTLMDQRKYGEAGFWFYQPSPNSLPQ
jgi:16S rRNA (guanine966-N2)-methyltransferase